MTTGELLANQIEKTREWTLKLIADLEGDDWLHQPQPGFQHALWLCGHLACAQELLLFRVSRVASLPSSAGLRQDQASRARRRT